MLDSCATAPASTFRALAKGAQPLGLPALGGLFEPEQCNRLDTATLSNSRLLKAIHALAYFTDSRALARVSRPACGSGHFLLAAARRVADAVARLDMGGLLQTRPSVVARCARWCGAASTAWTATPFLFRLLLPCAINPATLR
jgi:hypothetical protein